MKTRSVVAGVSCVVSVFALTALAPACSGSNSGSGFGGSSSGSGGSGGTSGSGGSGGSSSGGSSSGSPVFGSSGSGSSSSGSSSGGPAEPACPSGWQCDVSCPNNGTTSISGTVMDPAGANPLYNIVAYIPTTGLSALPSGVLTGADQCSCSALFQGNPLVVATTDVDGKFTIKNAPVAQNLTLVIQVGKWRTTKTISTTSCGNVDAGSINLPKNTSGGQYDSIPDIAVSTGGADSLECLLTRIGLDTTEYVPGWTKSGHIHIFNGGGSGGGGIFGGGGTGKPETNQMAGAPTGAAGLWDSTADLMKNDIVLLSCEGGETDGAIPQNLEDYLNVGGRAFASHYHYAWFTGSTGGGYTAPADWGNNLASWNTSGLGGTSSATVGGKVQTTLTGGGSFAKGVALEQWLTNQNALSTTVGTSTVATPELPVAEPRYNANVTTQKPSQSWIQLDTSTDPSGALAPTLYFSFDTPVNTPIPTDGGAPQYCGRAVFSGLHVGGASYDSVNCSAGGGGNGGGGGAGGQGCNTGHIAVAPPPAGCDTTHPLSPQEKALEFMLFDLSSCVVPDTVPPVNDAGSPVIPR